jgi:arylsulfatase A-like enzyme
MPQPDSSMTRRSFVEKVALAAGITAAGGGALFENLKPGTAYADTNTPPSGADLMNSGAFGWNLQSDETAAAAPSLSANPNILMIMVDQLRLPQFWLNSTQQATVDGLCPNIAWLRKTSYNFVNFYVAAQACTPSRATLLTGLYAPQVGMFATQAGSAEPSLVTGFPTFGTALADIAGYETSNIMWFGKWGVSNPAGGANLGSASDDTLPNYGFNTGRSEQIMFPSYYGSPNGTANSGNNGFLYVSPSSHVGDVANAFAACDDSIVNDFVYNWTNYPPTSGEPWFACVSFVNPHDISFYPGFFPKTTLSLPSYPTNNPNGNDSVVSGSQGYTGDYPAGEPPEYGYQPHSSNYASYVVSAVPTTFNYELTSVVEDKSWDVTATVQDKTNFLQYYFQKDITDADANLNEGIGAGAAPILGSSDYADFFNWYYYLLSLVDANIGAVLSTVLGSGFSNSTFTNPSSTTAIIFLSDHGDFGGSHGIHAKAGAVYDEALRVPLYVVTPSQSGAAAIYQMCSMVDLFKLVVELALGTTYDWQTDAKYCDQYYNQNQSIFSFIQGPTTNFETRGFYDTSVTPHVWYPFILTTTDETFLDPYLWTEPSVTINANCALRNHVMCMRTKSDANTTNFASAYSGGKLAIYSKWLLNLPGGYSYLAPIVDGTLADGGTIVQDYEYYDYLNYNNRTEVSYLLSGSQTGSDYPPALNGLASHGVTGSGAGAQHLLGMMATKFGNLQIHHATGPDTAASGYVSTMLTRTLYGVSGSTDLYTYTADAIYLWYQWLQNLMSTDSTCTS